MKYAIATIGCALTLSACASHGNREYCQEVSISQARVVVNYVNHEMKPDSDLNMWGNDLYDKGIRMQSDTHIFAPILLLLEMEPDNDDAWKALELTYEYMDGEYGYQRNLLRKRLNRSGIPKLILLKRKFW